MTPNEQRALDLAVRQGFAGVRVPAGRWPRVRVEVPAGHKPSYLHWLYPCRDHYDVSPGGVFDAAYFPVRAVPLRCLRFSDGATDVALWLGQCGGCGTVYFDARETPAPVR